MRTGRRFFLKSVAALAALGALPRALLAGSWPTDAFSKTDATDARKTLLGTDAATPSDKIMLKVPEIAENGAVVPVTVATTLEDVESISIIVENNPRPLAASFELLPGALPEISSRIKMGETSDVVVLVSTPSGIFSTSKNVKVTIGGCGG
jgi:sulfur-oxidizing protein SoxY